MQTLAENIPTPTMMTNRIQPSVVSVGAVSYLNSKPLICGLADRMQGWGELSVELPSRLADQLSDGEIDVGLIPVVEAFRHPDFCHVSDAAIACLGPVWSVRVFFRCHPSSVRTLALDEGSRTSVALSKVLFQMKYGFIPETTPLLMTDDPRESNADAVLVIGDRAMHPAEFRPAFSSDWDLGQVWHNLTGLPFVFAMWMARHSSVVDNRLVSALQSARDDGLLSVQSIALKYAETYRLTAEQCTDYLTNYIRFRFGDAEKRGLDEFRSLCDSIGL